MTTLNVLSRSPVTSSLFRAFAPRVPADVLVSLAKARVDRVVWNQRLAEYQRLRALSDAEPHGSPNEDNLTELWCDAQDLLVDETPAPDGEALAYKLKLIGERYDGFEVPAPTLLRLIEDARSLAPGHSDANSNADPVAIWDQLVREYQRLRAVSDVTPDDGTKDETTGDYLIDKRVGDYCEAMDALFDMPAPNAEAFELKLTLVRERFGENDGEAYIPGKVMSRLLDDARSLAVVRNAAGNDAELLKAWDERQDALAEIERHGGFFSYVGRFNGILDEAEMRVHELPAKTPEGVIAKLWVALSHMGGAPETDEERLQDDLIRRADMAAVEAFATDLDMAGHAVFNAIKSLTAMVKQHGEVRPSTDRQAWDAAVKAWEEARAHAKAGCDAEDEDERWTAVTERLDVVLKMPAPDREALLWKLAQLWAEDVADPRTDDVGGYGKAWFVPFYNDCFRLLRSA